MKYFLFASIFLFSCKNEPKFNQTFKFINTPFLDNPNSYEWITVVDNRNSLVNRITTPNNYNRINVAENSFASWLRFFPLKDENAAVYLYNGQLKSKQNVHEAVLDIDIGSKDLQQCADAVIRLRAEYLWNNNQKDMIAFHFTSGDLFAYNPFSDGYRPKINGSAVSFSQTQSPTISYEGFKKYLDIIFTYCGTYSLQQELKAKDSIQHILPGDVFIQGGFPGHAVIVMDVAIHDSTGEKVFLLAQSYMPAQNIHLLKNWENSELSPWFSANFVEELITPEWIFKANDLRQF